MDLSEDKAAEYRARAKEARKRAEEADDPKTRQDWLDLATGWDLLVESAERRLGKSP
jgi:hypothetical protein